MIKPKTEIQKMQPYSPPISGRDSFLRMDFNENTAGCSPKVVKAINRLACGDFSVYPEYGAIINELAGYLKVKPSQVMLSNGSDEAIKCIMDAYVGRKDEVKKILLNLAKRTGDINYVLKLKKESEKDEWKSYFKHLISDSAKKNRNSLLSRIYFHENDFKNAFEYSKNIRDMNYLELLAKKLSNDYPLLSCEIFRKLCFSWVDSGSGWPYKKAGKMLEAIKKLDKQGKVFNKTKNEIISLHKKKYSLMEIIENV